MRETISVPEAQAGQRLDVVLSGLLGISRSSLQKRIQDSVRVNGRDRNISFLCSKGDEIEYELATPELPSMTPQDIPLSILYEDASILVINKQAGLVVHAGGGTRDHTLVNGLLFHMKEEAFEDFGDSLRPGIVHRLDKDTSGVMVVAKSTRVLEALQKQFSERTIHKEYRALVVGNISKEEWVVDASIGRHPVDRKKMAVTEKNARSAKTSFKVLERFGDYTYVAAFPKTGRTHQIRVHLAHIKHPIVMDSVYGSTRVNQNFKNKIHRQFLHAYRLEFSHPLTHEKLSFQAPLPEDLETLLMSLRSKISQKK